MRTSIVAAAAFLDKLWGIPTLVDDPDATYLQKLAIEPPPSPLRPPHEPDAANQSS